MADERMDGVVGPGTPGPRLSERLRVLTVVRLVLGVTVAALGLGVAGLAADSRLPVILGATGIYLGLQLPVLVMLRRGSELAGPVRDLSLLADALWGTALLFAVGQPTSPLLVVLELGVVAATVLFGWRSGLKLALLDTAGLAWVVLVSVPAGEAGWSLGALSGGLSGPGDLPIVPGLAAAATLWVLALGTGYLRSVNERDLRRSYRELAVLHELNTSVERSLDLRDVSGAIARGLVEQLGYPRAVVWVPDAGGDLHPTGRAGFGSRHAEELDQLTLRVRSGPVLEAVEQRRPLVVGPADARPVALADAFAIDSAMVLVPLIAKERLLGLMSLELAAPPGRPPRVGERGLRILATLATEAALALDNARLHAELRDLSVTDALTGIYNHRHFQQRLQEELDRSVRRAADGITHPVSLILMDIDFFKRVNDRFGHPSGDELLSAVARLAVRVLRSTDIVCRYGGEEFGVILPDTTAGDALTVAERLREAVERSSFVGASGRHLGRVTCSFGVATHAGGIPSRDELIARADEALYEAKGEGRNRVVEAGSSDREVASRAG